MNVFVLNIAWVWEGIECESCFMLCLCEIHLYSFKFHLFPCILSRIMRWMQQIFEFHGEVVNFFLSEASNFGSTFLFVEIIIYSTRIQLLCSFSQAILGSDWNFRKWKKTISVRIVTWTGFQTMQWWTNENRIWSNRIYSGVDFLIGEIAFKISFYFGIT